MATLKDIAKLTKQRAIRRMAPAVYYLAPANLSTRMLFRFAKKAAFPKVPEDLNPQGNIDSGLYYLSWTDPGNGSARQADSFHVWLNYATENRQGTADVTEPQVAFNFTANEAFAFSVSAVNAFGKSEEAIADFNTESSNPNPPPPPPPPTPTGYSSIAFSNCDPDHNTLYLYLQDVTAGSDWQQVAELAAQYDPSSSMCPGNATPKIIPLTDGHNYNWVLVDPLVIGCDGNNPNTYACRVKGPGAVRGSKSGGAFEIGFP